MEDEERRGMGGDRASSTYRTGEGREKRLHCTVKNPCCTNCPNTTNTCKIKLFSSIYIYLLLFLQPCFMIYIYIY